MAATNTGKLIIRSIPDGSPREQIIDFLCSFAKGSTRESVAARLEILPLTLGNAMPAEVGNKLVAALQNLGAEVVFVSEQEDLPVRPAATAAHTDPQPVASPAKKPEVHAARKSAGSGSSKHAAKTGPANNDIKVLVILLLVLVGGLCGATAVFLPALKAASDPDLLLDKLLRKNAEISNKTCPRNINPQIRLDNFVAGNKKMTINYTLLNVNAIDVNGNDLRPSVSRSIRRGVCKEKNSAELLEKGIAFVFVVHGKDGGLIFDYQVVQEDCES